MPGMILKRCDKGHYYDGEIYGECPECSGMGQGTSMQDYGDYADEDSVTVALPRSPAGGFQRDPSAAGGRMNGAPQAGGGQRGFSQTDGFDSGQRGFSQAGGFDSGQRGFSRAGGFDGGQRGFSQAGAFDDEPVTAALSHSAPKNPVRKPGLKPVVGWLVCVRGSDFGRSFTIKLGKNFIGRSPENEIVLRGDDSIAAEKHAAVYYVPKQRRFAVEPGTSGRPFYLNRNVIMRPVWIKQHDILTVGNCGLMFFPCCGEHFSWEEIIKKRREQSQNRSYD